MKKPECEKAIRHLVHEWAGLNGIRAGQDEMPNIYAFLNWLEAAGHGHYLRFRSVVPPEDEAERWFDEELQQTWRD